MANPHNTSRIASHTTETALTQSMLTVVNSKCINALRVFQKVGARRAQRGSNCARRMSFDSGYVRSIDGNSVPQILTPRLPLQDTASQFVELSHRFASGREKLAVGSQVRFWLARPQGTSLWTYDVVGEDTLQSPELGPVQAFHLRPRPIANPAGEITAEIWFAPSLQYLPVRVRIALGGDNFIDLLAERIEQGAPPVRAASEPMNP